ncbi:MAG: zinc-ribbon domain-containing protein [Thiotrichaceae bacterium]
MHTQCPHCQTIFRINAVQLNAAEGFARCKHCHNIFNASKQLVKEPSQADKTRAKLTEAELADLPENEDVPDLDDIFIPQRRHSLLSVLFWLLINIALLGVIWTILMVDRPGTWYCNIRKCARG